MNFSAPSSMLSTSEKETETLEVQDQTNDGFKDDPLVFPILSPRSIPGFGRLGLGVFQLLKLIGFFHTTATYIKGQLGVPGTVYPWYFLCSTLGFLGIITHKYPLYRACIGISRRGTLVGVHPTIP